TSGGDVTSRRRWPSPGPEKSNERFERLIARVHCTIVDGRPGRIPLRCFFFGWFPPVRSFSGPTPVAPGTGTAFPLQDIDSDLHRSRESEAPVRRLGPKADQPGGILDHSIRWKRSIRSQG